MSETLGGNYSGENENINNEFGNDMPEGIEGNEQDGYTYEVQQSDGTENLLSISRYLGKLNNLSNQEMGEMRKFLVEGNFNSTIFQGDTIGLTVSNAGHWVPSINGIPLDKIQ